MSTLVLQLYEEGVPLTAIGTAKVLMALKDEDIRITANSTYDTKDLPRRCDNKKHDYYKKCIGGGICLAKKYKRLFSIVDPICTSCESPVIVDTLNYMFKVYYKGRYTAEWRRARATKRTKPTREEALQERKGKSKKEQQMEDLKVLDDKRQPKKKSPSPKETEVAVVTLEPPKPRARQRKVIGRLGR